MKPRSLLALLILALLPQPGAVIIQHIGAAATPVTQIIVGGNETTTPTTAATNYSTIGHSSLAYTATEALTEVIVLAGTISELHVVFSADVGTGSDAVAMKLRKNGADTALTCSTQATSCDDVVNSFSVVAGDRISMQIVTTNTPVAVIPSWTIKWVGTNSNESMLFANYSESSASVTQNGPFGGAGSASATGTVGFGAPAPVTFTITKMYARAAADIASGCRRINLLKSAAGAAFAADSSYQIDLSTGVQSGSYTATTVSYSTHATTPDRIAIQDDPGSTCGGTSTATQTTIAVTLAMTNTSLYSMTSVCANSATAWSQSVNNYLFPVGFSSSPNATETNRDLITRAVTQKGFAMSLTPTPGAGGSWAFTLRDDAGVASGVFGCSIANPETMCGASGTGTIADASLIDLEVDPTSTPTVQTDWCATAAYLGS